LPPVRLRGDHHPKEDAMKYMMLVHHGPALDDWESLSEEERATISGEWAAIRETPGVTPGLSLQPPETATTVRAQDGTTLVTDGPFVEIKEAIGGYFVFEADDLDAAIDLASRVPSLRRGGAIEVRPIAEW
jgi:hypothetical protein